MEITTFKDGAYLLTPTAEELAAMQESDVWALGVHQWLDGQAAARRQRSLAQLDLLTDADRDALVGQIREAAAAKAEAEFKAGLTAPLLDSA